MSDCGCGTDHVESLEKKTLIILLLINGLMFLFEAALGWYGESTGLIADSLDMLADAMVYGLSFYAVGHGIAKQRSAATFSGYFQIVLGIGVIVEVVRRSISGSEPLSGLMISVALVALIANIICLILISKHREGGVHMRASWIFSTNDVIANLGVIIAGILVWKFNSSVPDLIIGAIISAIVIRGGLKILQEAKEDFSCEKST